MLAFDMTIEVILSGSFERTVRTMKKLWFKSLNIFPRIKVSKLVRELIIMPQDNEAKSVFLSVRGFKIGCYRQIGPTKTAPLLISPIEMRVLWMEIKYIKSASRLLDRNWVNKRGLDLSKEVLWVSVGQRAAELPAIKVGGKKKFCQASGLVRTRFAHAGPIGRIFCWPPTLTAFSSAAL